MRVLMLVPLCALFGCAHEAPTGETTHAMPESASSSAKEEAPAPAATQPAPAVAENKKDDQVTCDPVKVHFALDSDQLYDSEKPLLDSAAKCLSENNRQRVTIVGNTDERGATAYNQALGQRRADTVAKYLEGKGADPTQVEAVVSHGEDSPICDASNLKCWQLNRRTAVRESCHM